MQNKVPNEIIHKIQSLFQQYYGPNENYSSLVNQLLSVEGIGPYLQKISKFEKNSMDDAIAEMRFASLFSLCGFKVTLIPESNEKGGNTPDLEIKKNSKIGFVEVKHRRSNIRSSDERSDDGNLKKEQDFKKSEGSIRQNVEDALPQLYKYSQNNKCDFFVIAIWISNDEIWDVEVQFSVPSIKSDMINNLNRYTNDILLIYGSNIPDRNNTYFHARPLYCKSNVINQKLIQTIEDKSRDEIFGRPHIPFLEWLKSKNIEK